MWGVFVAIEHVPSGMTARADFGRSMVKMRDECRKIIRGKLWHLEHGAEAQSPTEAQRAIADHILGNAKA